MKDKYNTLTANLIIFGLIIILVICLIISFSLGRYPIQPVELFKILISKVVNIEQTWSDKTEMILFNVRLPRIIISVLVGCCLSAAGAAYQGIFKNPMVSPDILGSSSGAAFGAALAILMGCTNFGISLSAFCFSILTVAIVCRVSKRAKNNPILGLVLSGIMVGALFSSGTSFLKLIADLNQELPAITYWLMGSFSGVKQADILIAFVPMLIGLIALFLMKWKINILAIGEDEARSMGVETKHVRLVVIIGATLITAVSISVSGMIGWVGLVIPHLSRMLIGCDYRKLLPTSMLMGAIFMLIVDSIARLATTSEIPIGILTSFIGAPFFLYLITKESDK